MDFELDELLYLVLRWAHVIAGIFWIGTTAYFSWLDRTFERHHKDGRMWMIHSGGFYVVEKRGPQKPEGTLHWFKWEAMTTWLTGLALLALLYHWGALLIEPDGPVSVEAARAIGFGSLVAAWIVYDLLWSSPLGKNFAAGAVISFALLMAASWGLHEVLSGRAAYIHLGAMLGTVMVLNVWLRILPAQRKLLAVVNEGRAPDLALSDRAKQRSKHNTFMAFPVVLLMLSSHFPTVSYGHAWAWQLVGAYVLAGWAARAVLNRG